MSSKVWGWITFLIHNLKWLPCNEYSEVPHKKKDWGVQKQVIDLYHSTFLIRFCDAVVRYRMNTDPVEQYWSLRFIGDVGAHCLNHDGKDERILRMVRI